MKGSSFLARQSYLTFFCTAPLPHSVKHQLGFVHRDVKAENVLLLSEDRLKLADFGFSTQLVNGRFLFSILWQSNANERAAKYT